MYRLFCCRNRKTSKVEIDKITDSLEQCLSVERGVTEFRAFLQSHDLEEPTTLEFALRCDRILTELARLSPSTENSDLPATLQNDIGSLYEMADNNNINFDSGQMDTLKNLPTSLSNLSMEKKRLAIETVRGWAIDLLRQAYNTFRREVLRGV